MENNPSQIGAKALALLYEMYLETKKEPTRLSSYQFDVGTGEYLGTGENVSIFLLL